RASSGSSDGSDAITRNLDILGRDIKKLMEMCMLSRLVAEFVEELVFGSLYYPTNDYDDLGKLKAKADTCIFVGYAPTKKAYRIYNKRTRKIQESVHVIFDELTEGMTSVQPKDAPTTTTITSPSQTSPPKTGVEGPENTVTTFGSESFENTINEFDSEASSSGTVNVNPTRLNNPPIEHGKKWTKDHPLENTKDHLLEDVIADLNRPVSTRRQLKTNAMWCFFNEFLENVKPKNFKEAIQYPYWIDAM
nr:retrovirus-related Pol polyprotein from transposon TNT 1-94 [Tanacetum cinerariifolium]